MRSNSLAVRTTSPHSDARPEDASTSGLAKGHIALAALLAATALVTCWPGHVWLAASWCLTSLLYVQRRYGVRRLYHPVVAIYAFGLLSEALGFVALAFTPEYQVSATSERAAWLSWTVVLVTAHYLSHPGPDVDEPVRPPNDRLRASGVVLLSSSLLGVAYFFHRRGIPLLSLNPEADRVTAAAGLGSLGTFITAAQVVGIPILALSLGARSAARVSGTRAFIFVGLIAGSILSSALVGSRVFVVRGVAEAVLAYAAGRSGAVPRRLALVMLPLSVYVAALLGRIRFSADHVSPFLLALPLQ